MGVITQIKLTPVIKTQVYLSEEDLETLHRVAKRNGKSVAALIREAVRTVWLRPEPQGPVAIWSGPIGGTSIEHDSIYDEP
jgi:hypothetical protein